MQRKYKKSAKQEGFTESISENGIGSEFALDRHERKKRKAAKSEKIESSKKLLSATKRELSKRKRNLYDKFYIENEVREVYKEAVLIEDLVDRAKFLREGVDDKITINKIKAVTKWSTFPHFVRGKEFISELRERVAKQRKDIISESQDWKQKKVDKTGGCQICGYNGYLAAMDFHHVDPLKKDKAISKLKSNEKKREEESKKCVILCSNCHRGFHSGDISQETINKIHNKKLK